MSEFEDKLNSILSNPEAMGQIMNLAQSLGGGSQTSQNSGTQEEKVGPPSSPEDSPFSALGLDPKLLELASQLMSAYQSDADDSRTALLVALRPFVREERYAKLDQAIRISKLTRMIRIALDSFRARNGEGEYV